MYPIYNVEFYKLYDAYVDGIIDYFYSKDELVKFIACWFHNDGFFPFFENTFLDLCTCSKKDLDLDYKRYILYDNLNRIINVRHFEEEALNLYKEKGFIKTWDDWTRYVHRIIRRKHRKMFENHYVFRKDPVPYTRKWRGGPYQSPPHTAKIMRMYGNPDYKYFNKGSKRNIPQWWDDRSRCIQKSWKEQSKARHQWQRGIK